jgi:3-hydroxyacyl-[acyl-carrier-protein] dehydratase
MASPEILAAIPHRDPVLLLDEIVEQTDTRIVCRKRFSGDEFWYQGHYPKFPITPGVLLCEAEMQAGALLLSRQGVGQPGMVPVATRADRVQFKKMVFPGDTIEIEVELLERLATAYFLKGRITANGKVAARLDFACTLTQGPTLAKTDKES